MNCLSPTEDLIDPADRDSMHILPLGIVPLEHPMLRRARLVKNVAMLMSKQSQYRRNAARAEALISASILTRGSAWRFGMAVSWGYCRVPCNVA